MRLDLVLPNEGPFMLEALQAGAHFEAMGWDGLWLTDHLLGIPEDHMHDASWTDLFVAMAHVAAQTKRVRIGSGVAVLPHRDPVLTAKMVAGLDHLSGGRIDFGVGVGWLRREFQALGRGHLFDVRGPASDEALDVILACWKGGVVDFHGRWFDFDRVTFEPAPLQSPRVPLWIGGLAVTGAPLRRAAKYADYWHPSELDTKGGHMTPATFRAAGERLDEMAGRGVPRTLRIKCDGAPQAVVERLHAFAEAGCVQVACSFLSGSASFAGFEANAGAFLRAAESLRAA